MLSIVPCDYGTFAGKSLLLVLRYEMKLTGWKISAIGLSVNSKLLRVSGRPAAGAACFI